MEEQEPLLSEATTERTESEEERTQTELNDPPPLPDNDTSKMQGKDTIDNVLIVDLYP